MYSNPQGPRVVVAAGQTDSPAMIVDHTIGDATEIAVHSPAVLAETATIETSHDFDVNYAAKGQSLAAATAAATWETEDALGAAGAVALLAVTAFLPARAWRIHLNGAAAADRVFNVTRRTPIMVSL